MSPSREIFALIGNTPLSPIRHGISGVEVYAKLEYFNPSGSVKDRAVKGMIEHALAADLLGERTLIEATSGNTGIALAAVGAALRVGVHIIMPSNASPERKRLLATLGAQAAAGVPRLFGGIVVFLFRHVQQQWAGHLVRFIQIFVNLRSLIGHGGIDLQPGCLQLPHQTIPNHTNPYRRITQNYVASPESTGPCGKGPKKAILRQSMGGKEK